MHNPSYAELMEDKELCLRKQKKIIFFAVSALFPSQMKMKNVISFLEKYTYTLCTHVKQMKGKENDGIFAKKIKKVHFRDSVKTASSFDFLPT